MEPSCLEKPQIIKSSLEGNILNYYTNNKQIKA